jgi:hypothetical protein
VRAVSTNLSPDEWAILRALDTSVATEFLRERLKTVQSLIRAREAYLAEVYPEGTPRQSGEADVTAVYRQEQRMLEELLANVETDLSCQLQGRLERAQRRWHDLEDPAEWPIRSAADRRRRLAAWTEKQILTDLLREWHAWLEE